MRKLFILIFVLIPLMSFAQGNSETLIYDEAVTSTNDSLTSSWVNITDYRDVELAFEVGDSVSFLVTVEYKYGGTSVYDTVILNTSDSVTNLANPTAKFQGKLLRGSGATTNLIAGANYIRIKAIRQTYSTAVLSSFKGWVLYRK